jgi:hypothetical protein
VHPYTSGQVARLRSLELAREAAAHRTTHIRRPASADGVRPQVQRHLAGGIRRTDAGLRHHVGMALIRTGMRIVDPGQVQTRAS